MEGQRQPPERYCSFCYGSVEKLLYCGKCRKRGYCSAECQRNDWKTASHKFWCGKGTGEMFTDIEIRPIQGIGLGMVALRPFAKCDIIFVERPILLLQKSHIRPNLSIDLIEERARDTAMALTPNKSGATLFHKFMNNSMGCGDEANAGSKSGLFLTLSRINHDCLGNAEHIYLEHRGVKILVACRPIAEGEEITIAYLDFRFQPENRQSRLFSQYSFRCRCSACTDARINADLLKMARLDEEILQVGSMGRAEVALKKGEHLLKLYDQYFRSSWHYYRTYYDMFQMAVTKRKTLSLAASYIQKAYKAGLDFCHDDEWDDMQRIKPFVDSPQSHRNYLLFG